MNKIQIIADSLSPQGHRLITAIATFPRYLLAEVNTHRMLSRNSASSRAIRFEKMVQSVTDNPFVPFKFQKDHPGMQGTEYFEGADHDNAVELWHEARRYAISAAMDLNKFGVTKQICNRLLEPFMYHTALISGTELENFFALRADDAAEIHFQDLAYKFLDAVNFSEPQRLQAGEYHMPFGNDLDKSKLADLKRKGLVTDGFEAARKISVVRAARISYAVPGSEIKHDYEADIKLHDRLASSGHMSAFEHCARVMGDREYKNSRSTMLISKPEVEIYQELDGVCGNFRGFIQYRKMFGNENRSDNRLIKK